jgi:predicted N-acetyltransferase YhbS
VRVWIGYAKGALDGIAVVARLFVDLDYRGHREGQELMRTAYQHAVELGKRLVFDVMLKGR